jgi:pilus assembly protein Flp/PilA
MMMNKLRGLVVEEKGQGMTEYGLVLGIIAVAVVIVLVTLKDEILKIYNEALSNIQKRDDVVPPAGG